MSTAPPPASRHGDRPRWWQTRGFVAAMALLALLPLVWPAIPPLVDLPGHMGRYRVQLSIGDQPWLAHWYDFRWQLIGNLGVDLAIEPMARVFGLELGTKLVVMAIPALTVTGLLSIAREVHGRIPATALFALPLAYSYPFQFGFVNFALSVALALNLFAWWLRLARQGRLRFRAAAFVPLSVGLWVCHTVGWGMLAVLAFSAEMIRQHDRAFGVTARGTRVPWRRDDLRRWGIAWVRAGLGVAPLALPLLLMALWRSGDHVGGRTFDWFDWRAKFQWILMIFRDRWMAFDVASLAVLFLILFRGFRDPSIEYSRQLGLSALFLLTVFLVLPRVVFGSAYADMRLAPFAAAIAVVAIRPRRGLSSRGASTLAVAGLAFVVVRMGAATVSYAMFADSYGTQLAALDRLPQGARLVSFVGETCHNQWTMSRLEHLPAIALERRLAYTNDQWSMAGAQLLTTRYVAARRYAHDPSQIVTSVQCPREYWRPISRSLARFPRDAFDYVWLIRVPDYDPALERGLIPLWRHGRGTGSSALFRVDHSVSAPEMPGGLLPPHA
ncbi:hypothetical protein [Sphingomonas bacterium]|uniref:hypothetical protein n=1 Tax=Sphingomonas bacterium TaxID=1895847 RepID=UPI001576B96D|nr:hypothetical protein [Sphingomonas bacterium]